MYIKNFLFHRINYIEILKMNLKSEFNSVDLTIIDSCFSVTRPVGHRRVLLEMTTPAIDIAIWHWTPKITRPKLSVFSFFVATQEQGCGGGVRAGAVPGGEVWCLWPQRAQSPQPEGAARGDAGPGQRGQRRWLRECLPYLGSHVHGAIWHVETAFPRFVCFCQESGRQSCR